MWIRCENKVLLPHDMSDIGWCQTWYRSTPGYSKSGLKWNNKIIIITSAVLDVVYWPVIGKFLQILRPHWSKRTQLLYSDINVTPVAVDRYNTLQKLIMHCGYFRLNNAASYMNFCNFLILARSFHAGLCSSPFARICKRRGILF